MSQTNPSDTVEDQIRLDRSLPGLRDFLDSLYTFAGVLAPDGIVLEANQAALVAASLKPTDVIGKHFAETYWWSFSSEIQAALRAAIKRAAGGESSRYDVTIRLAED